MSDTPLEPPAHYADDVPPIFVSIKDTSRILGLSRAETYKLLDSKALEARYFGRRRLVLMESLRRFADSLPSERIGA